MFKLIATDPGSYRSTLILMGLTAIIVVSVFAQALLTFMTLNLLMETFLQPAATFLGHQANELASTVHGSAGLLGGGN